METKKFKHPEVTRKYWAERQRAHREKQIKTKESKIPVKDKTKKLLDGYKKHPRQPYDEIINWLINLAETTKP